jgi:hypothetical protein
MGAVVGEGEACGGGEGVAVTGVTVTGMSNFCPICRLVGSLMSLAAINFSTEISYRPAILPGYSPDLTSWKKGGGVGDVVGVAVGESRRGVARFVGDIRATAVFLAAEVAGGELIGADVPVWVGRVEKDGDILDWTSMTAQIRHASAANFRTGNFTSGYPLIAFGLRIRMTFKKRSLKSTRIAIIPV